MIKWSSIYPDMIKIIKDILVLSIIQHYICTVYTINLQLTLCFEF